MHLCAYFCLACVLNKVFLVLMVHFARLRCISRQFLALQASYRRNQVQRGPTRCVQQALVSISVQCSTWRPTPDLPVPETTHTASSEQSCVGVVSRRSIRQSCQDTAAGYSRLQGVAVESNSNPIISSGAQISRSFYVKITCLMD